MLSHIMEGFEVSGLQEIPLGLPSLSLKIQEMQKMLFVVWTEGIKSSPMLFCRSLSIVN